MEQTPRSKSIMLYEGPDFGMRLEYNKDFVILHLPYCHKMTKTILFEMQFKLEDWWQFFKTWEYPGIWTAIDPKNEKLKKLMTKLDFVYRGTADGLDVYQYGE